MEPRKNTTIVPRIRVKDMQKSLDFYIKTLGLKITDELILKDGKIVYASVGFDSPLLMLSPIEYTRTPKTKEDLAKNKLGVGVDFCICIDGSTWLDELSGELKTAGISVIDASKTQLEGEKLFTITDPDGYTISFTERAPQRTGMNPVRSQRPTRRMPYVSIFSIR